MITGSCHCGAVTWGFDGDPETATACNCTSCRRYGALWAFDWLGERITSTGETKGYLHGEESLGFHHCPTCGAVTWWRAAAPHADGRTRIAVNLRTADDPDAISHLPIRHFDGLESFAPLPPDGRCVRDMWF